MDRRDEAIALYNEAILVYNAVGARLGYASCLLGVGQLLTDPAAALERYWQVQAVYVEIGARYSQGRNLFQFIAIAQIKAEQIEAAIDSLTEAAAIGAAIGFELLQTYALAKIAELRGTDAAE